MGEVKKLLVIDDEENMRHYLMSLLENEGYEVREAGDGQEGLKLVEKHDFDAILCDVRMPGMDGIGFLQRVAQREPMPTVITMSAYGTIDLAVKTMQLGAYDYISKPFKPAEIILALKKAEERERLKQENVVLRREIEEKYSFGNIIGKSPAMQAIFELIKKVAHVKSSVLITGESGTGKELVAKAIHYNSPRKDRDFLAINCGAIPETLLESELFGHKKGSFTGASQDRKGFFEEADSGTLFLDEIGDIPINLQVKLLRVLQESEIRRVGEERSRPVDVRVIAATAKDLLQEVSRGAFREDLFYRLNVLPVNIPPLRERKEDIPSLVDHFIGKYNAAHSLAVEGVAASAMKSLLDYHWPGNIRELENIIERAMVLTEASRVDVDDIPDSVKNAREDVPEVQEEEDLSVKRMHRKLEAQLIIKALHKTGGNKSQAAKLLEISYPALLSKIDEYHISVYKE